MFGWGKRKKEENSGVEIMMLEKIFSLM